MVLALVKEVISSVNTEQVEEGGPDRNAQNPRSLCA